MAPYRLIGFAALSVDNAITFSTPAPMAAWITFSAPWMLVFTHSIGLYSAAGTCLRAAAWITTSTPRIACVMRSRSRTSPRK
jgi:hypothetical protein